MEGQSYLLVEKQIERDALEQTMQTLKASRRTSIPPNLDDACVLRSR